jgi:hypothetical protein
MRDLIRDHLRAVLVLLSGFILASVVVLIADAPTWARILAALLAVVSLSLVVAWLRLRWSEWTARHGWRLTAAAAPALLALVVLALGVTVWRDLPSAVLTDPATLILFDSSEGMADELEGGDSKFDEATDELDRSVRDLGGDQLGLASFGIPSCDSDSSPADELVSIGPDRAEEVGEKAHSLTPTGQANLVSAARDAIGLLDTFEDERQRLILITAGLDDCGGELSKLLFESAFKDVTIQLEIVGLGLSAEEKEQVGGLPDEVRVHLADTSEELDEVFQIVFFEEPIRDELAALTDYVQVELRDLLEAARLDVEADPPRPESAQKNVALARQLASEGKKRFGEFATEAERAAFAPVKDLLREQFDRLQEAADIEEDIAQFDEAHGINLGAEDRQERDELIARLRDSVDAYNETNKELNAQIEEVLEELFAG